MDSLLDCRPLTPGDVEPAAEVIAQAFQSDPLVLYMLPSQRSRIRTLTKFFRVYGEINIRNGRAYGVGKPLQGVAYWVPPGQNGLSVSLKSLSKFVPLLFSPYVAGYYRAYRVKGILPRTEALHKKYANAPHYYLDNLGVLPSAQGKGYSSKLIRPILARADEEHVLVYTDTVTLANVPYYEHFGFECVEECPIAGTDLTVFALRRPVQ
jgi:GNAT superfamily N-acetyltransferase